MGFLHDIVTRHKKRCTVCGCIMFDDSDSDICEVCLDELYESDPGEPEDEESLYPNAIFMDGIVSVPTMFPKSVMRRKEETPEERVFRLMRENAIYGLGGLHTLGGSK